MKFKVIVVNECLMHLKKSLTSKEHVRSGCHAQVFNPQLIIKREKKSFIKL